MLSLENAKLQFFFLIPIFDNLNVRVCAYYAPFSAKHEGLSMVGQPLVWMYLSISDYLRYLFNQLKNSRFHTTLFCGWNTWCASFSNDTKRASIP